MARGGPARRAKLGEASQRQRYALNGVPKGTFVSACFDKYGRWELGYKTGVIVQRGNGVHVKWDGVDELEWFTEGDARYLVDRGKWRLYIPPAGGRSPLDALNMRGAPALTRDEGDGRIALSPPPGAQPTEEVSMTEEMTEGEKTFSAKQVATRIGTDAKTLRKFFRSGQSTVEPVGQGGRYDFAESDIPTIKAEFEAYKEKSGRRGTKAEVAPEPEVLEEAEEEFEGLEDEPTDEDAEPSEEDLEELEDLLEVLDDDEETEA